MKLFKNKFIVSVTFLILLFNSQTFPQFQIPFSVISSGGIQQSNSSYTLNGSLGQAIIGQSQNTINQVQAGFWYIYYQNVMTDIAEETILPTEFKLEQNYPNPFNPSTIIKFAIPERASVLIKIYDPLGSEVRTLINEEMDRGWYTREFNAVGFASGFYIYRMQAGNYISTKKMLVIK